MEVAQTVPALAEDWPARADVQMLWLCLRWKASDRKARLFACACLRRLDHLLPQEYRQALSHFERFADGWISAAELEAATEVVCNERDHGPFDAEGQVMRARLARNGVHDVLAPGHRVESDELSPNTKDLLDLAVQCAYGAGLQSAWYVADWAHTAEHRSQCELLADIFGMPLAPAPLQPEWLAWNGGTIVQLAQAIYDERRFEDLPILADALEEAGCTNATIFDHCRQPIAHVRGCWALDAILGKH